MSFPNPTILPASTKQWRILIGGMVIATGASLFLVITGLKIGWYFLIFFLIMTPLFLLQLHPKANYVCLTTKGFHLRVFFRSHEYRWADIKSVFIASLASDKVIAFDFNESYEKLKATRQITKRMSGFEGSFPVITSQSPESLLELVNAYRKEKFDA